jgi:hypothetical protein
MQFRSPIPGPTVKDPPTQVRVLAAIRVGGVEREIGTKVTMSLSDAQALRASVPPSVEILS